MKSLHDVRGEVGKRFDRCFAQWAQEAAAGRNPLGEPLVVAIGAPGEREALADFDATSEWARGWLDYRGPGAVRIAQRSWRSLASQRIPTHLEFCTADDVAGFVRRAAEWNRVSTRLRDLIADWGSLNGLDRRTFAQLLELPAADWERMRAFLLWVHAHPTSGLLPRQLPIPGIDSKWFEAHRSLCLSLRRATLPKAAGSDGFGLRTLERPLTLRVLDARLRTRMGGLTDFSATPETLATLQWNPETVIVCENLQCAYSFGDLPGTVLIAKQGYAVDVLNRLPWLHAARIVYWGDLDTHGFAILNRFRGYFPRAESMLMDEATLLAHEALWGVEPKQSRQTMPLLTDAERHVLEGLRSDRFGPGVRLEQERIAWDAVEVAVATAIVTRPESTP